MNSMWVLRQLARRWVGGRAARDNSSRRPRRGRRTLPHSVRLAVEALEDRTLLSVLPAPITTGPIDVTHPAGFSTGDTTDNESAPTIAYDPVTPTNLVAVYSRTISGKNPEIDLATSTDGGQTWTTSIIIDPNGSSPTTLPDPADFSTPQKHYTFATNASVAFDRAHNFYVSALEGDGADGGTTSSGALVVQRYSFGATSPDVTAVIYQWASQDPALNPQIAVDSNLPSYTDPVTGATVTDRFANPTTNLVTGIATDPNQDQVYVSWNTSNTAPTNPPPTFNPNTIKVAASSDGGNTFSTQVFVNATGNFGGDSTTERDALPTLAVAQGSSANLLPGGQLTVAWNNFATNATSIVTNRITNGGSGFVVDGGTASEETGTSTIIDAGPTPSGGSANVPMTTTYDLDVSAANPPANFTITDMDVSLALVHPNVQQLKIVLIDPTGKTYTLVNNGVDAAGNDLTATQGIKGVNLGVLTNGANPPVRHELDTVFDAEAARSIHDPGAVAPFTAHFAPEGPGFLTAVNGKTLTSAAIDGLWKLQITDFRNDGTTPPPAFLQHWSLDFTAGLTTNADKRAAGNVRTGDASPITLGAAVAPFPLKPPSNPTRGVSPAPSLAVDNSLGSFSPFQGRLYIAYTGAGTTLAPPDLMNVLRTDTDVYVVHSDNGGLTWSAPLRV
ncbi:MAG TPA: hypothetical protein VJ739_10780, partial [Gemmataceae bacterium]|nr:hypothetical protein [Gemmataceae bacterium]